MTKHSPILGGSTSERLLQCPGSFQATQALPPVLVDTPSEYSEYGTALHAVMEHLFSGFKDALLPPIDYVLAHARGLIGTQFYDREFTQEHMDEAIEPALRSLQELMDRFGGGFVVAAVELRVKFPGVAGAFGTTDLVLTSATHALLVDYKFGAGVPVRAVYSDPLGDTLNAQIMFYLAGAIHTEPTLFRRRTLVIAILQPRAQIETERCTFTEVTRKEVRWFVEDVENAIVAALARDPPLNKGHWCRWCPAKPVCRLWTGPLQELIELSGAAPVPEPAAREITPYAIYLARVKDLVDLAAALKKDIDGQMHAYLENGGKIPGWHLKLKPKNRQWADPEIVQPVLHELGFKPHEIFRPKLVTFESADATARRLNVTIPAHLRPYPPSTETTLATDDDAAPIVDRKLVIEQFAEAYEQLKQEQQTEWPASAGQ